MLIYEITDAFKKENLSYAIVGGYALALQCYIRATVDVDLDLIDIENIKRLLSEKK